MQADYDQIKQESHKACEDVREKSSLDHFSQRNALVGLVGQVFEAWPKTDRRDAGFMVEMGCIRAARVASAHRRSGLRTRAHPPRGILASGANQLSQQLPDIILID